MKANIRNFGLWVVIGLLIAGLFTLIQPTHMEEIPYSRLINELDQGRVRDVVIQGPEIHGTFADGRQFRTYTPNDPTLLQRLYRYSKEITIREATIERVPWFVALVVSWLPFIAVMGVWIFLSRKLRAAREAGPRNGTDDLGRRE
jgi:cell division protease FtsH